MINKYVGLIVNKTENIFKDNIWLSSLCVLAFSSVICQQINLFYAPFGFQKYQKMINQKIYPTERSDSNNCLVLEWTCISKKRNYPSLTNHFVPKLKLLKSTESKVKRKHIEKLRSLSKVQNKMDSLFLNDYKNNNETTKKEQNITLNPKEIISSISFAFKGLND